MTMDTGMRTWIQARLERGHHYALHVKNGWVFGTVRDFEPDVRMVYDLFDGLTTASADSTQSNAGSGKYWWTWRSNTTTGSKDIFYERDVDKMLQAFIGIWPHRLRLFRQFPAPKIRGNLDELTADAVPTDASQGFFDGLQSPFHMPMALSEMLIPKEVDVKHALFNPELYTVQPLFNVFIRRMIVDWRDPKEAKDRQVIHNIISKVEGGPGLNCHLFSPGIDPWEWDSFAKVGVKPIPELTLESLGGVN